MYNDFYRTPSPLPHPVKPPPPDLPPQHQPPMSQSFATPSYIQRSGDPPSRTGNSPPLMPRVPSSMMTDRLNWRHEEGSQAVRGAVNPSEFYPRVPGALVDRQSYTQSQPAAAAAINIGQPVSDLGFYSFAIQSTPAATFSRSQPAIQPHAAPIQYSANGMLLEPFIPASSPNCLSWMLNQRPTDSIQDFIPCHLCRQNLSRTRLRRRHWPHHPSPLLPYLLPHPLPFLRKSFNHPPILYMRYRVHKHHIVAHQNILVEVATQPALFFLRRVACILTMSSTTMSFARQ